MARTLGMGSVGDDVRLVQLLEMERRACPALGGQTAQCLRPTSCGRISVDRGAHQAIGTDRNGAHGKRAVAGCFAVSVHSRNVLTTVENGAVVAPH
jgi:hypothetical protein